MKSFKKALNIISWILSFFMFFTVISMAVSSLFGYRYLCVSTGSMEPEYPVGSVIVLSPADPNSLSIGDVVTFKSGEALVTHRIISVDYENQTIRTKGDNNSAEDFSPVEFSNIVGKVIFCKKYLGYPVLFAKTKAGIIVYFDIIIILLFAYFIVCYLKKESSDEKKS